MIEYPIMFADLRADTQVALLEFVGVKHQKDMNWDVMPICVVERPVPEKQCRKCGMNSGEEAWCNKCIDKMNKEASKACGERIAKERGNEKQGKAETVT